MYLFQHISQDDVSRKEGEKEKVQHELEKHGGNQSFKNGEKKGFQESDDQDVYTTSTNVSTPPYSTYTTM